MRGGPLPADDDLRLGAVPVAVLAHDLDHLDVAIVLLDPPLTIRLVVYVPGVRCQTRDDRCS